MGSVFVILSGTRVLSIHPTWEEAVEFRKGLPNYYKRHIHKWCFNALDGKLRKETYGHANLRT